MSRPLTPEQEDVERLRRAAEVLDFGSSAQPGPKPITGPTGRRTRRPGWVYVIRCGSFVKIGSTSDVPARLRKLQSHNPHDLTLLATFSGGQSFEFDLHKRFKACRHRDEWFREEGELAAWIAEGCPV